MKFTIFYSFNQRIGRVGVRNACKEACDLGFTSVELLGKTALNFRNIVPDINTARYFRKTYEEFGLKEACYSVSNDFWDNPKAEENLKMHVEIAAELGSPYLHHTVLPGAGPTNGGPDFDTAVQRAIECSIRTADYAKHFGITCLYEDQGEYVNGIKGFGVFYNAVKSSCKNVGVCADVGNIYFVDENPEDFIKAYIDDIKHVHVKDYQRKPYVLEPHNYRWDKSVGGNWLRDTIIGDGIVDLPTCLKLLKDAGYDGCFALENSHPEDLDRGTTIGMQRMQKLWEE